MPAGSTRITFQYTYAGVPVITNAGRFNVAYVDGQLCGLLTTQDVISFAAIWHRTGWPWPPGTGIPPECSAAPATVRVCEGPTYCSPEFLYEGHDVLVDWPIDDRYDQFPDVTIAVARFIHEGLPQTVTVRSWLYVSDGATCATGGVGSSGSNPPATVRELGILLAPQTTCGPNFDVTFNTVEFGDFHGSFVWQGEDLHYDVDTGAFAQTPTPSAGPSPTLTASATVSPAALPDSGGAPGDTGSSLALLAGAGLLGVGLTMGAALSARRRSGQVRTTLTRGQ